MAESSVLFHGVTKDFRLGWRGLRVRALANFTCEIPRGRVFGLLGPNGSGKSTVLKIAAGLVRPDQGTCRVLIPIATPPVRRLKMGYHPESGGVYDHLTGRESLDWFGRLGGVESTEVRGRTTECLNCFGLLDAADIKVGVYSKGMRQRLGMAQATMGDPVVLLLDEPFTALDPIAIRSLMVTIRRVADQGMTVLLTSHLLARVEEICDFVGLLHRGHLIASGPTAEVFGPVVKRCRGWDEVFVERVDRWEAEGGFGRRPYE